MGVVASAGAAAPSRSSLVGGASAARTPVAQSSVKKSESERERVHRASRQRFVALGIDALRGELAAGALLDALVIDPDAPGSPVDLFEQEGPATAFEKWLMLGDDRNTHEVYVHGKRVLH